MNQRSKGFWFKVLRFACLVAMITGVAPTLAVVPATEAPWRLFWDALSIPFGGAPTVFSLQTRQISAVLGGVLVGWAWLLFQLSDPKYWNARTRRLLIQSLVVWYVLDSGGSLVTGLPGNAVSNTGFLVLFGVPLWKLGKA